MRVIRTSRNRRQIRRKHTEQGAFLHMKPGSKSLSARDGSLFTSVRWPSAKMPKRADALANLDRLLPWGDLEALTRTVYQRDQRRTGRPGYPAGLLLRCLVLQWFWTLSDDQAEATILDSYSTARFIGCDPWQPRPPSASAMRGFRLLLDEHGILEPLRALVDSSFAAAGLTVRPGMIREPVFKKAGKAKR